MEEILNVANFIFEEYKKISGVAIDEMKLHKLLYFAQRETIAILNEPLFEESMQAWDYGPVSVDVRMAYTKKGIVGDNFRPISSQHAYIVKDIILQYGSLASWKLSEMSHQEISWLNARKTGSKKAPMSLEDIREDAKSVRPYDSLYDMYYDEFDDLEEQNDR